jgi:tetratricopeptide (TPR) repeat protein
MAKKLARTVKASSSKAKRKKVVTSRAKASSKVTAKEPIRPAVKPDPRFTQAVQNFESGMKALQEQKFDRAKGLLEKVIEGPSRELAERARVYLNVCSQQLARSSTSFKTPEEHYDYAVALMNRGDIDSARTHMEKIIKGTHKADYAHYGLAVLECISGKVEESLRHLEQAVKLNPSVRYQARNDSDFNNMADDPRFTELIYPEPTELLAAEGQAVTPKKR